MKYINYFLLILFCFSSVIWMNYNYNKEMEKSYHNDFKDREFNILTKVTLPDKFNKDFIQYRKDVYNESWLDFIQYENDIHNKSIVLTTNKIIIVRLS